MEAKRLHARFKPQRGYPKFADSTSCRTIEIFQYEGDSEPKVFESSVDDTNLSSWLDKDLSAPSDSGFKSPISGLRLLIATYFWTDTKEVSITKDSSSVIERHFEMHDNFWGLLKSEHTYASDYSIFQDLAQTKSSLCRLFFKNPQLSRCHFQLSLNYHISSPCRLTTVFLVLSDTFSSSDQVLALLKYQAKLHFQPLLLPLLLAESFIINNAKEVHQVGRGINNIAIETGQQSFLNRDVGLLDNVDLADITKRLNLNGTSVEYHKFLVGGMKVALDKMEAWATMVEKRSGRKNEAGDEDFGRRIQLNKLSYLKDMCDSLLLTLDMDARRIQLLLQVVYQFVAQKDTRLNISLTETSTAIAKASKADSEVMKVIAIQTKRDSSAMKTIAILGMLFLPGTFVAAVFSMPIFTLAADGKMKNGAKIYCAVTLPLTALVFVSWFVATSVKWGKVMEGVGLGALKRWLGGGRADPALNVDRVDLRLTGVDGESEEGEKKDEEVGEGSPLASAALNK